MEAGSFEDEGQRTHSRGDLQGRPLFPHLPQCTHQRDDIAFIIVRSKGDPQATAPDSTDNLTIAQLAHRRFCITGWIGEGDNVG